MEFSRGVFMSCTDLKAALGAKEVDTFGRSRDPPFVRRRALPAAVPFRGGWLHGPVEVAAIASESALSASNAAGEFGVPGTSAPCTGWGDDWVSGLPVTPMTTWFSQRSANTNTWLLEREPRYGDNDARPAKPPATGRTIRLPTTRPTDSG